MEVWAKTLTGRTVSVWAEDGETVKSVKSKVEAAIGNAAGMQHRLFHRVGTFSICWEDPSKMVEYLPGFPIPFCVSCLSSPTFQITWTVLLCVQ